MILMVLMDSLQLLLIGAHLVAFPSVLLFLAAGAVFGLALGAVLTWIGTSIGQLLAFCVGRSASASPVKFLCCTASALLPMLLIIARWTSGQVL